MEFWSAGYQKRERTIDVLVGQSGIEFALLATAGTMSAP